MRLLLPVDATEASRVALRRALHLPARAITLLHVLRPPADPAERQRLAEDGHRLLDQKARAAGLESDRWRGEVLFGKPADEIVTRAGAGDVDLLVLGTGVRSPFGRLTLRSVTEEVIRRTDVPTLVIREDVQDLPTRRLIVAMDFSPPSLEALATGVFFSRRLELPLEVVNVVTTPAGATSPISIAQGTEGPVVEHLLGDALRRLTGFLERTVNGEVQAQVVAGSPAHALARVLTPGDLLVCGTHGRSLLERLAFGSVARQLVRSAPCPLIVVRSRVQDAQLAA